MQNSLGCPLNSAMGRYSRHAQQLGTPDAYGVDDWTVTYGTNDPSVAASDFLSQAITAAQQLGQAYLTYDQQRQLNDINIALIQQGKAPLDPSQYGVGVRVGLSPQVQQMLWYALIGLGVFFVVKEMGGRRKRR